MSVRSNNGSAMRQGIMLSMRYFACIYLGCDHWITALFLELSWRPEVMAISLLCAGVVLPAFGAFAAIQMEARSTVLWTAGAPVTGAADRALTREPKPSKWRLGAPYCGQQVPPSLAPPEGAPAREPQPSPGGGNYYFTSSVLSYILNYMGINYL